MISTKLVTAWLCFGLAAGARVKGQGHSTLDQHEQDRTGLLNNSSSVLDEGHLAEADSALTLSKVVIDIVEARNLNVADYRMFGGSSSDPFVQVKDVKGLKDPKGSEEGGCLSSTQAKTLDPVWNERCEFFFNHKLSAFKFKVWDEDENPEADDKPLGKAKISISEFFGKGDMGEPITIDRWLPLEKGGSGQLHVKVTVTFGIPIVMPKETIPLPRVFSIGLAWDFKKKEEDRIDLDASVIGLNRQERQTDLVYYGRLTGFNGGVRHSGNDTTGEGDGDDEVITIDTASLSSSGTEKLAVMINAYTGQKLTKVKYAYIRVFEGHIPREKTLGFFGLNKHSVPDTDGLFFGVVANHGGGWIFQTVVANTPGRTASQSLGGVVAYGNEELGWKS